jgi:pyruvate dehydrogenase E2 component (dihydrolipoamide acetyltransferase)
MARLSFKMPDIGEGVHEGEIVKWYVSPGAEVAEDDPLVEVMTDKATVTISSPRDARVIELRVPERRVAKVGDVLVVLDVSKGAAEIDTETEAAPEPARERQSEGPVASAVGDIRESVPGADLYRARKKNGNGHAARKKTLAAPATRKRARELGVDLSSLEGSGPEGRITRDDLERAIVPSREPGRAPSGDERRALSPRRRTIAARMEESRDRAVQLSLVEECDFGALVRLRDRLAPVAEKRGVRLHFLPFVVKATVAALREYPDLNARYDDESGEMVVHHRVDLGIAAAVDEGLLVPVLRDAESRSLLGVAKEIERLGRGARENTLTAGELRDSTFSITSLGKLGGLFATPILNPPELGILGVHRVKERPVVRDGEIAIAPVAHLSLSFDHRFIDGEYAASFLYAVIDRLETPEALLLEMGRD